MSGPFSYQELDSAFDARIRLAAAALLASVEWADFRFIREQTGATDGNLGAHMKKLVASGYVTERKRFVGNRPNTSYQLTDAGRTALERHMSALQSMISPFKPEKKK